MIGSRVCSGAGNGRRRPQGFEAGVNLRAGLAADITVRFLVGCEAKRVATELTRVMNLAARTRAPAHKCRISRGS